MSPVTQSGEYRLQQHQSKGCMKASYLKVIQVVCFIFLIIKSLNWSSNTNLHLLFFLIFSEGIFRWSPLALISAGSSLNAASLWYHRCFKMILKNQLFHMILFLIFLSFCAFTIFWCAIILNITATTLVRIQDIQLQGFLRRKKEKYFFLLFQPCSNCNCVVVYRPHISVCNCIAVDNLILIFSLSFPLKQSMESTWNLTPLWLCHNYAVCAFNSLMLLTYWIV